MDICSPGGESVSEEKGFCSFYEGPFAGDISLMDAGNDLTESLKSEDDSVSSQPSYKIDVTNFEKEDLCEKSHQRKLACVNAEKYFHNSATFPCSAKITPSAASVETDGEELYKDKVDVLTAEVLEENDYSKTVTPPCPRSTSLPTSLKLLSAMKGSREKQGTSPKKLTVTWAPDVYDPAPSAESHAAPSKSSRHRSDKKKHGKNKQKGTGKHPRGSKGKDKKQGRKHGGTSNRGFNVLDVEDGEIDCDEPQASILDFNVGTPDPFCGRSFLKQSVMKLHFSVAEAT